ncbi:hypothetical protein BTVI_92160 [Pitangus sulphuratus]|nr:hypothetical protein BTVI_92160 [Pitangus sulphuratus]
MKVTYGPDDGIAPQHTLCKLTLSLHGMVSQQAEVVPLRDAHPARDEHAGCSKAMDSESKNSFIGSFLQPPDQMLPAAFAYIESKKLAAVAGDRPSIPNNQAVVAALKTLQEKIHRLELEKAQAEVDLCSLSRAAAQYKKALEHESYEKDTAHQELMQHRKDASEQLNAAQSRCSLLEKQLDYMKKMVSSVELEKKIILEQQDKIKHLEEKICKEDHQHRLLQDKKSQLQIEFHINRILMSSATSQREPDEENGKKKNPKKVWKLKRKTQKLKQGATHVKIKCGDQMAGTEIGVTAKESILVDYKILGEGAILELELEKEGPSWTGAVVEGCRVLPQGHNTLPCHSTKTQELNPQLQLLLSRFGIDHNLKNLNNSADEMDLFSLANAILGEACDKKFAIDFG